jgi:hypothetical protein
MYLLFLDEFGDFGQLQPFDDEGSVKIRDDWRPICGYAGMLIPARNYIQLCEDFALMRVRSVINTQFAKYKAIAGTHSFNYKEFQENFNIIKSQMYSKKFEVKGNRAFSTSYINSVGTTAHRKRNRVIRRANNFIKLLGQNHAEIFYYGIEKSEYFKKKRRLDSKRSLHVALVRGVIERASLEAISKSSQIKIIFDHHNKDDETKARIQKKSDRVDVAQIPELQTRKEYCMEVILEKRLYRYLKEPMFSIESHWSLGIQAADWICALLGKVKTYISHPTKFTQYKTFSDSLGENLDSISSSKSEIEKQPPKTNQQLVMDLFPKTD